MADQTSTKRISAVDRARQALTLRRGGLNFKQIAEACGYRSPQAAHKAVVSALRGTLKEPAEELRNLELQRLDQLQSAVWPMAMKGVLGAVDRCLEISKRRSILLGLAAPTKIAFTDPSGEKPYENPRERLLAKINLMAEQIAHPLPPGIIGEGSILPSAERRQLMAGEREDATGETGSTTITLPDEAIIKRG